MAHGTAKDDELPGSHDDCHAVGQVCDLPRVIKSYGVENSPMVGQGQCVGLINVDALVRVYLTERSRVGIESGAIGDRMAVLLSKPALSTAHDDNTLWSLTRSLTSVP